MNIVKIIWLVMHNNEALNKLVSRYEQMTGLDMITEHKVQTGRMVIAVIFSLLFLFFFIDWGRVVSGDLVVKLVTAVFVGMMLGVAVYGSYDRFKMTKIKRFYRGVNWLIKHGSLKYNNNWLIFVPLAEVVAESELRKEGDKIAIQQINDIIWRRKKVKKQAAKHKDLSMLIYQLISIPDPQSNGWFMRQDQIRI